MRALEQAVRFTQIQSGSLDSQSGQEEIEESLDVDQTAISLGNQDGNSSTGTEAGTINWSGSQSSTDASGTDGSTTQPSVVPTGGDSQVDISQDDSNTTSDGAQEQTQSFSLFSEAVYQSEERGLTHWLLYSDGSSIYAYNPVSSQEPTVLLNGLRDVTDLAVDQNKGFLYVAQHEGKNKSTVSRYAFSVMLGK